MPDTPLVLLVEDDIPLGQAYMAFLHGLPCRLEHVSSGQAALDVLQRETPAIMLLDLLLPDIHGQKILEWIQDRGLSVTAIVVTTLASTDSAVKAVKAGASDYLVKPLDADRLRTTVQNALAVTELQRRLRQYETLLPDGGFEGFIGNSPAMRVMYGVIDNAARSEASVFITGESGTGKELCAEAVHRRSRRASGPFVAVNCAAIPRDLVESELFGHIRGAFTGATADRIGAVERADGGTLFFDEICEMDLDNQSKLLRFLQTRQYQPVGSNRQKSTDVRFICATNRDPWQEVQAGRFREDLYYRLYVVPIAVPPLRNRGGDILLLARTFLDAFAAGQDKRFDGFSPETEGRLRGHYWPGNVRELQNSMHNLAVMNPGGRVGPEMLTLVSARHDARVDGSPAAQQQFANGVIRPLWQEEREAIERAIRLCDGNVAEAADRLQISDSTIYRKRRKWGD